MTIARKRLLAKIQRLSSSSDFGRVYATGASMPGRFLVVWRFSRTEAGAPRVGVVASKRALGKAHDRNRAKRLLRESVRSNRELFLDGVDYVLIARRRILGVKAQDVSEDMRRVFDRME